MEYTWVQWIGIVMLALLGGISLALSFLQLNNSTERTNTALWIVIGILLLFLGGCGSPGGDSGGSSDPSYPDGFFVPQSAVWDVYYGAYQTRLDLVGGSTIRVEVCCGRVTVEDDGYAVEVW